MYQSASGAHREVVDLKVVSTDQLHNTLSVRYKDNTYTVKAMPFLSLSPKPSTLHCVAYDNNERVNLIVDIFYYLNQAYKVGDVGYFEVKTIYPTFYELRDENGFTASLKKTSKINLYQHQKVKCKVWQIDLKRLRVNYLGADGLSGDTSKLSITEVKSYFDAPIDWDLDTFAKLLVNDEMDESFEEECYKWLKQFDDIDLLMIMRADLSHFLERSEFLMHRKVDERSLFENRLSQILHLSEIYLQAKSKELLPVNNAESSRNYVANLLDKLRISGYLYNAEQQFDLMICIFTINEALMQVSVPLLLDVLLQHSEEHWKNEPFRRLIVRTLELYIRTMDQSIFMKYENDAETIENMVRALFVQRLFVQNGDEGLTDASLNLSRLFRYVSYMKVPHAQRALDHAYNTFYIGMEVNMPYTLSDTKQPTILAHKLMNSEITNSNVYESYEYDNTKTKMIVYGENLTIEPSHGDRPHDNQLPAGLFTWRNIQVRVPDTIQKPSKDSDSIPAFEQMWNDISHSLFDYSKTSFTPIRLYPGQRVELYVYSQDDTDPSIVHCRMVDDEHQPTNIIGIMRVHPQHNIGVPKNDQDSIVGYYFPTKIDDFISDKNGKPYILEANYVETDENDRIVFSMRNIVEEAVNDNLYTYGQEVECLITDNSHGQGFSAISKEGVSFWIQNLDHKLDLTVNDVVLVKYLRKGDHGYAWGTFIETIDVPIFSIPEAFHRLMDWLSDDYTLNYESYNTLNDTSVTEDNNDLISQQEVIETMLLIGRKASLAEKYTEAYNYLAFARLLAQVLERPDIMAYYNGRMKLILILHEFAVNGKIDKEGLDKLGQEETCILENDSLHNDFEILKTLSCLNHPEHNATLWETYASANNERLQRFASWVLANNLLKSQSISAEIQTLIKEELSLEEHDKSLKNYGVENTTTEFKTSIVYPPNNNMQPNIEEQMLNITKVVAAFLNTDGGHIYIGVNDLGVGVGLKNDLRYKTFSNDKDKYIRTIHTMLQKHLGNLPMECVKIAFDDDYKMRDVCVISVEPYMNGVKSGNVWFVRQNSQRVDYNAKDFETHNNQRKIKLNITDNTERKDEKNNTLTTGKKVSENSVINKKTTEQEIFTNLTKSKEQYIEPEEYLNFSEDGQFAHAAYEMGNMWATLPYYTTDEWLIIVYDDGHVLKVDLNKIREKAEYRMYAYNASKRIIGIFTAKSNDKLLSMFTARNKEWMRIDALTVFPTANMTDEGQLLEETDIDGVKVCAIVTEHDANKFRKVQNLGTNSFDLSHHEGKHNKKMIRQLGILD